MPLLQHLIQTPKTNRLIKTTKENYTDKKHREQYLNYDILATLHANTHENKVLVKLNIHQPYSE